MPDVNWPLMIIAVLCAVGWRKHRGKQGKKVSWYTDLLVAAGVAFVGFLMVGFFEGFVPAFTQSFVRSFVENYERSSGGVAPSMSLVYAFLAAYAAFLVAVLAGLILGGRYIWMRFRRRRDVSLPIVQKIAKMPPHHNKQKLNLDDLAIGDRVLVNLHHWRKEVMEKL